MSRMSDLHLTLSCAIQEGEYTFAELAEMYNVPFEWVNNLAIELAADGVKVKSPHLVRRRVGPIGGAAIG